MGPYHVYCSATFPARFGWAIAPLPPEANQAARDAAAAPSVSFLVADLSATYDAEFEESARTIGSAQLFEVSTPVGYYIMLALQLNVFRVGLPNGTQVTAFDQREGRV
jgi:hypothetical protein